MGVIRHCYKVNLGNGGVNLFSGNQMTKKFLLNNLKQVMVYFCNISAINKPLMALLNHKNIVYIL